MNIFIKLVIFSLFSYQFSLVRAQFIDQHHQHHISKTKLNAIKGVLILVLLIIIYYVACYRRCWNSYGWWASHENVHDQAQSGLESSVLDTFPVFLYSENSSLELEKGSLECPVCLSMFEEGEKLRKIPKCEHVFHLCCVNRWLAGHTTCPLCRAELGHGRVRVIEVGNDVV